MKLILSIIFVFAAFVSQSQIQQLESKQIDAEKFYIDKLGNFYFQKANSIQKTNSRFEKIADYSNSSFSNISYVDVSDPFRTLVFYKDFNQLVYLDNFFAELRDPILFDDINLYNIDVVCSASQGGFWVYEPQNSCISLINKDLVKIQQGNNLNSVVNNSIAKEIIETNNYILVWFESDLVLVFDKFGNFYKQLDETKLIGISAINDVAFFMNKNTFISIDFSNLERKTSDFSVEGVLDFQVFGKFLYILTKESLITFEIL